MANRPTVARTVARLRRALAPYRQAGERIALVPTMGALHRGHLALVREARRRARRVVVSIFVNPTQFAPHEDFASYPRRFAADLKALAKAKADLVWAPSPAVMYPEGFATRIEPQGAAMAGLEDKFRPHFFGGVATVVAKLFTQVSPDFALFGQKDYQQLRVVTQMAKDLDLPLKVIGVPTVREKDGLALSSRNAYLSAAERSAGAGALPRAQSLPPRASKKARRSSACSTLAALRSTSRDLPWIIWKRATRSRLRPSPRARTGRSGCWSRPRSARRG